MRQSENSKVPFYCLLVLSSLIIDYALSNWISCKGYTFLDSTPFHALACIGIFIVTDILVPVCVNRLHNEAEG
jgi:hypothetical protein